MDKWAGIPADGEVGIPEESIVDHLIKRIRDSARFLLSDGMPSAPADRVNSFRYLLLLLHAGYERGLAQEDPYRPQFSRPWPCHVSDWGGGSPDAIYRTCALRGDATYRIYGTLGNADHVSFQVLDGSDIVDTLVVGDDVPVDGDGGFAVVLGPGGRRPLAPGANMILTREFCQHWSTTTRTTWRISCDRLGTGPWPVLTSERVQREFDALGEWIYAGGFEFWGRREAGFRPTLANAFGAAAIRSEGKLPVMIHGHWDLGDDQALIVDVPDSGARFWGLQACDFWWRTLDFANCLTTYNCAQAAADSDGHVRIVVAHRDPGVFNWLDTTGLRQGVMLYRLIGPRAIESPATTLVDFGKLDSALPAGTARIGPDERRDQIAERREGVSRLLLD